MSEHHSSIDSKVQKLVDEDTRRQLFQRAAETMMANIDYIDERAITDEDDGLRDRYRKRHDIIEAEGHDVVWLKPESASYTLNAEELDDPKELELLGVESVALTYFPPRMGGGKEYAESVVLNIVPIGADPNAGDALAYKLQVYDPGLLEEVDMIKIEKWGESEATSSEATAEDLVYVQKILDVMHRHDGEVLATP